MKSGRTHSFLDIRFEDKVRHISILVELKNNADNWNKREIEQQLQAYVECQLPRPEGRGLNKPLVD